MGSPASSRERAVPDGRPGTERDRALNVDGDVTSRGRGLMRESDKHSESLGMRRGELPGMRDGDAVVGTAGREFGAGARSGVLQTGSGRPEPRAASTDDGSDPRCASERRRVMRPRRGGERPYAATDRYDNGHG